MSLEKTLWTTIQDLVDTGRDVSSKLDTAFNNVDNAINQIDINSVNIDDIYTKVTSFEETTAVQVATNTLAIDKMQQYVTGFNLRDKNTFGILELCGDASSGEYWRIDESNVYNKITGATTFGDGVTPLADRTFCHRPSGSEMSFYIDGVKHVKTTTQTLQLNNVPTKQIIVYDRDTAELTLATSVYNALTESCIVSVVTGNPTLAQKVIFANERHGMEMSSSTHLNLHETDGTKYGTGLNISGMANNGTTFTSIASGSIWDEDIKHAVSARTTAPFAYRDTNGYWALEYDNNNNIVATNDLSFTNGTNADSLYNRDNGDGTWSLVDTGSDYVINHVFATNDSEYSIFKVVGQALYPDRTTARHHLGGEMAVFQEGDLPTPEFLHLYSYILDGNGKIETGTDGEVYIDYRQGYPISRY